MTTPSSAISTGYDLSVQLRQQNNIRFNASQFFPLGILPRISQFITESSVTPSFFAKSLIRSTASILTFLKCSPNVFGFSG